MDKKMIMRNFSRYAYTYDRYADIQKLSALKLLKDLDGKVFRKILEIGCGTGNYTLLLKNKFRQAKFKAIDISGKMIEVAREKLNDNQIDFITADAETVNIDENFDCITSNACFQWFDDLGKTLEKYTHLLNKDGTILFSIFGPSTFLELNTSLRCILEDVSLGVTRFMSKDTIKEILKRNFKRVKIKEAVYKESFLHLRGLLHKIKYSGISVGALNGKVSFNRRLLNRWEEIYLAHSGGKQIEVTYQVFFCQGQGLKR